MSMVNLHKWSVCIMNPIYCNLPTFFLYSPVKAVLKDHWSSIKKSFSHAMAIFLMHSSVFGFNSIALQPNQQLDLLFCTEIELPAKQVLRDFNLILIACLTTFWRMWCNLKITYPDIGSKPMILSKPSEFSVFTFLYLSE